MKRLTTLTLLVAVVTVTGAGPALACGGLVNPNGTVSLVKTTTMAGYRDGVEHYVTSFQFNGGGAEFGSIVPLPGVPSKVERGGDWTLQRLVDEVSPAVRRLTLFDAVAGSASGGAQVILETQIDALDITVLKGGGDAVGKWAEDNGFLLTPDTPEVLDFYAERSPIFLAARFDPKEARERGQQVGDGTPIHVTIPTPNPWVPLRILGLGLGDNAPVEADVFLLTDNIPAMLPRPAGEKQPEGMVLERSERASGSLLADLRSDKGMGWIPKDDMWLTYLRINEQAGDLKHDLALDVSGQNSPSPVAAGLEAPVDVELPRETDWWQWAAAILLGFGVLRLAGKVAAR
jgi:hypothetical protein